MILERVWAMPSQWTFTIPPIRRLVKQEMNGGLWIDPYCGNNSPAQIKNDLNPDNAHAQTHMDACDFLKSLPDDYADGILYDPPYSPRQVKECYDSIGIENWDGRITFWSEVMDELERVCKIKGKVISFGWSSNRLGMSRGFKMQRVLLVPHGSRKQDTIVTVETKVRQRLF